ncbi:MAG: hypothetical protein JWN34_3901 [Bryobacterales bacterium]|nr:hypothetical protein [Bryobacterales bacterium]
MANVVMALAAVAAAGQTTARGPERVAAFDVVSVKPTAADDRVVRIEVGPGGRFVAHGYSLKLLVQRAFGVKGFQVAGGPSWLDEDRFNVEARAAVQEDLTEEQLRPMLQTLLQDRFGLRYHLLTKALPGFALSVTGKGSKLKRSAAAAEQSETAVRRRGAALVGEGVSTKTLATLFGAYLGKPVADETGLRGLYDFEITWTERADVVTPERVTAEEAGVSLVTALREQLGLKLKTKRVNAEIVAVDRAEKASAN